jgi:drug/metabolite transporter (DMT)-like permease
MFSFGSLWILGMTLPAWSDAVTPELTPHLLAYCLFNIIGGTLLTYLLNTWALTYTKSSLVALFIYLQPPIAAFVAWVLMGETVEPQKLFASAMVFVGLLLAIRFSGAVKSTENPSKDLPHQKTVDSSASPKVHAKTPETS